MKKQLLQLNILHILNDGFQVSFLLLAPFIAKDLHLSLTQVGFLGTLMNVSSIVLGLPAAYLALRLGSIRVLFFSLLCFLVAFCITGVSPNYLFLIAGFGLGGIAYGLFHPIAFSFLSQNSEKTKRGKVLGNFTALGDVGKIPMSGIATFIIAGIGWRLTSLLYIIFGGIVWIGLSFIKGTTDTKKSTTNRKKVNVHVLHILTDKKFFFASITSTLDSFASSSLYVFLPFLFLRKGINPVILGSFTAAFFIGNFLGKALLGRSADKFTNTHIFIVAELCMAFFLILLANTHIIYLIILSSVVLGFFTKGTIPVAQTMVSEAAEDHGNFEKAFGLNATIVNIAATLSPLFLGFVSDKFSVTAAFNVMAVFALLAIIPAFAYQRVRIKRG